MIAHTIQQGGRMRKVSLLGLAGALMFAIFAARSVLGQGTQSSTPPTTTGTAPQQDVQAPLPSERVRVPGKLLAAQQLHMVQPVYPAIAKTARIQGTVVLHAVIAKDGTIKDLQYVSGPPLFMHSAMDAVRQWTYKPYLLNGEPVEVDATINVIFALGDNTASEANESASLHAEEILLKDGSTIVGRIVAVNGDTFEVQMKYSRIEVNRTDIVSITFPENQPAHEATPATPVLPQAPAERKVTQSLAGTTYTNSSSHFVLTVPDGWRTNDQLAEKISASVGALSSTDGSSNIIIQWNADSNDPKQLAQMLDSMFKSSFEGYQKISELPVTIDGQLGDSLVFRAIIAVGNVSAQAGTDSAATTTLKIPAKYLVTMIKARGGTMIIMCIAPETFFDKMQPAFTQITASFRSVPPETAAPPKPNP
jgi:TonB family protein